MLLVATPTLAGQDMAPCAPDTDIAPIAQQFRADRIEALDRNSPRYEDLHRWNGPLQNLMASLEGCIVDRHLTRTEVLRLMDAPNEIIESGGRHQAAVVAWGDRHFIYWWRGGHDYLYFVLRDDRVVGSRWWYAGE